MPIRFACAECGTEYTAHDSSEGAVIDCHGCGSEIRIPPSMFSRPVRLPDPESTPMPPVAQPVVEYAAPVPEEAPVEYYLPPRRSRPRVQFQCPYCGSTRRPRRITRVSAMGWLVGAILLVTTCVLCWVGALITETSLVCADCGIKLGGSR
jgi:DNA-directed RNA polymerase subunit RPC12/RpoP